MTSWAWIMLKDASWVSVIGVICIATFALSYVVKNTQEAKAGRHEGR